MASQKTIANITPVQRAMKSTRFTKQDGWRVWDMDLGANSVTALSGWQESTQRTFVELIVFDQDREGNCRIVYSKEFEKYEGTFQDRFVSFLGHSSIVTSANNRIQSYDINKNVKINDDKFNGTAASMTVSEGKVYVGLYKSNKVIVCNSNLMQIKTITLSGLEDGGVSVIDTVVLRSALFVRTSPGFKALVYSSAGVELTSVEPLTAMDETEAWSIGVSSSGLVFVLWGPWPCTRITVHDMDSLVQGHGSRHLLFCFNVDESSTIRIKHNRLVTVDGDQYGTGEVRVYDLKDVFTFGNLLAALSSAVNETDLKKLVGYFSIPADRAKTITDISALVHHLTERGTVTQENTLQLIRACRDLSLDNVMRILSVYQRLNRQLDEETKQKLTLRSKIEELEEQHKSLQKQLDEEEQAKSSLEAQLMGKLDQTKNTLRKIIDDLHQSQKEAAKESEALKEVLERTKLALDEKLMGELDQTKNTLRKTIDDLHQSQKEAAKESEALKEVLERTKLALDAK